MDVVQFLSQKVRGVRDLGLIFFFPNREVLSGSVLRRLGQRPQYLIISFAFIVPQDKVGGCLFVFSYDICRGVSTRTTQQKMDMIGHDDKGEQAVLPQNTTRIQTVHQNTLDDVRLEDMSMTDGACRDEIQRVETR